MDEKISEMSIRQEKISKLRAKILAEIEEYTEDIHEDIRRYLKRGDKDLDDWNEIITKEFCLLRLKEFIEQPKLFQSIEVMNENKDTVIYQVSDDTLNIWLQEDYNFTFNFLIKIECGEFDPCQVLSDGFFEYDFTSIFDRIHYCRIEKIKDMAVNGGFYEDLS